MTDLITPDEVRRELAAADAAIGSQFGNTAMLDAIKQVARLCRDYLTLWDRNKELEKAEVCSVCVGRGKAFGGRDCICGGKGTIHGELHGLRGRVKELKAIGIGMLEESKRAIRDD